MKNNMFLSLAFIAMLGASSLSNASYSGTTEKQEDKYAGKRDKNLKNAADNEIEATRLAEKARIEREKAAINEAKRSECEQIIKDHKYAKVEYRKINNPSIEDTELYQKSKRAKKVAVLELEKMGLKVKGAFKKGFKSIKKTTSNWYKKVKQTVLHPFDTSKSFYNGHKEACIVVGVSVATIAVTVYAIKNCRWLREKLGLIDEQKDQVIVEDSYGNLHMVSTDTYQHQEVIVPVQDVVAPVVVQKPVGSVVY